MKNDKMIVKKIQKITNTYNYDWMGNEVSESNPLHAYSNISADYFNYALLTETSFNMLDNLKNKDKDLYDEWQWVFYAINFYETKPSIALNEMINELQEKTDFTLYGDKSTVKNEKVRILIN